MSRKIKALDEGKHDAIESVDTHDDHIDREFQFEKTGEDLEEYIQDIAETVRIGLDQSIAILTPWFFNNLPRIYYQTTPRAEKVRHLSAVITGHVFETKQTVELWDRAHSKVTYIGPGGNRSIIIDMASKLEALALKMGSLYFSRDKLLFLSSFFCKGFKKADLTNKHVMKKITAARKSILAEFPAYEKEINHYLEHLDHDFPQRSLVDVRQLARSLFELLWRHNLARHALEEACPQFSFLLRKYPSDRPQLRDGVRSHVSP